MGSLDPRTPLQIFRELPGQAGNLVELIDRLKAPNPLPVGEQAGRLGDREPVGP
jgi:hypothetical protein